ncbi:3-hydroxyisobutyrate dehydrogenase-like beta-hydroxyacid dehydrogenase OS=Castellaniella defragrans OX=75697 GN=HNR28_001892 PE=4 SV=1 [Castellaniella defragrans]
MRDTRLGLIGYGEVGGIFCAGLAAQMESVCAWDLKLADAALAAPLRERAARDQVSLCTSAAELCTQADLVVSAVTASNTVAVAREAAAHLRPGTVFLDLNSASPGAKREAGAAIEAAGGHYVEAGVMSSVPPHGIRVPMLLGGPHAESLAAQLNAWGMDVHAVSPELGIASAIKMCRSVMIKGLEALVVESYTTARAYGVEDYVLPTLHETFPSIDWSEQGRYFYSRVVQHGKRRAEEMREVANTVREAGFEPLMSSATAQKQDWVAKLAAKGLFEGVQKSGGWQAYADRLIQQAKRRD